MSTVPTTEPAPLFDLAAYDAASAEGRLALERHLDHHLQHSGFLTVAGHGIPRELIRATRQTALSFFALEADRKGGFQPLVAGAPGYYPFAAGSLARTLGGDAVPDLKESFTIGPVLPGAARAADDPSLARWFPEPRWPELTDFEQVWTAYYAAMDALARRLLGLFANALDLPADWFDAGCRNPTSTLSAVHYPGTGGAAPQALRAGAHSDYGTLTILHKQPGADDLEVRLPDGRWSRQRPGEDVFVVNTGDLLAQWTNDRWVSTVHRVVVPDSGSQPSLSLGFFHQPDADCLVEALPSCVSLDRPIRYAPVRAGDHLAAKWSRQHATAGAE